MKTQVILSIVYLGYADVCKEISISNVLIFKSEKEKTGVSWVFKCTFLFL